MRYRCIEGIEVKKICGQYFLVSHRSAWNRCPVILMINETAALLWSHLSENGNEKDLVGVLQAAFSVDEGQAAEDVSRFCESLYRYGYCEKVGNPDA